MKPVQLYVHDVFLDNAFFGSLLAVFKKGFLLEAVGCKSGG